MQMLHAGGYPVLYDDERAPDEDNLRGYFEYGPIRRLEHDHRCLANAEGRAIKVVSPLLYHLPPNFTYRLIFVQRSLDEVLRSQAQMLARRGQIAQKTDPVMQTHFERHLRAVESWIAERSNFSRLMLDYTEIVSEPRVSAQRLAKFLGCDLDLERMAAVVDPSLYRQRTR